MKLEIWPFLQGHLCIISWGYFEHC